MRVGDGHAALFEPCCLSLLPEIEEMAPFSPKVLTANQGHRVSCAPPRGVPEPQVWWERNQERVPAAGRVHQEAEQLVFTSITEADAGTYTCHAANKAGEKKQELSITVASREGLGGRLGWARLRAGCGVLSSLSSMPSGTQVGGDAQGQPAGGEQARLPALPQQGLAETHRHLVPQRRLHLRGEAAGQVPAAPGRSRWAPSSPPAAPCHLAPSPGIPGAAPAPSPRSATGSVRAQGW